MAVARPCEVISREYLFRERGIPRALVFPVGPPPTTRNGGYDLLERCLDVPDS